MRSTSFFYFLVATQGGVTNTISVDCFRPVKFSALLSFIIYHRNNNTADALLHTFIKSSDYQAHFTAVFDIATSLFSLNNHSGP